MDANCQDCLFCEERPDANLRRRPWCRLWDLWDPQERASAWCEFGESAAADHGLRRVTTGEVRR